MVSSSLDSVVWDLFIDSDELVDIGLTTLQVVSFRRGVDEEDAAVGGGRQTGRTLGGRSRPRAAGRQVLPVAPPPGHPLRLDQCEYPVLWWVNCTNNCHSIGKTSGENFRIILKNTYQWADCYNYVLRWKQKRGPEDTDCVSELLHV